MKLIAAQVSSIAGDISQNLSKHVRLIDMGASHGADGIFFPELSLTGYQPALAESLAMLPSDPRLDVFQQQSDRHGILIAVGAPTRGKQGIEISMITFQPGVARCTYSKQHLHADELPFFSCGMEQRLFSCAGHILAPAICYESLQASHALQAAEADAQVYFTSVAKSERGVAAAYDHYPRIARQHAMTVLMANCVGAADDYAGAGQSAIWNSEGKLLVSADASGEALVIYDSCTGKGEVKQLGTVV